MAEPYVGEIRYFSFNFAPAGWAQCNGQILQIKQNIVLYAVIGKQFGGDGITTFALPNLQGRVVVGPVASGNPIIPTATVAGEETHTLTINEMPAHTHIAVGSDQNAARRAPQDNFWATPPTACFTNRGATNCTMSATAINGTGGGQAHTNMQPFLVLNFCIAMLGYYPSRN